MADRNGSTNTALVAIIVLVIIVIIALLYYFSGDRKKVIERPSFESNQFQAPSTDNTPSTSRRGSGNDNTSPNP